VTDRTYPSRKTIRNPSWFQKLPVPGRNKSLRG
jgi:hypothetical protein